ncbi:hypothetical protein PHYBLDRAFT_141629 [Phycomyces blakesleeanus NRRL 1555(-)]|uniref:t-SNARE coiled-coil homology domain-containing protein n=1 Tax=Phycomyces blakesleeanus (strain ATCC 8743b / DSM 1359 / FGSC 10004 / NBRC 33097 / NRRL 1555) TaxID=763407 RepID=A0A167PEM9_PHYB8|nr:hypothetical protein PHYBLDRAFT_141629 [Phycomyces blakesleeanus NRRL 1555(-)]OAD77767.1 hypothetical protein PHYBLDRAFT_141629 [Phycomyces blakesleeanus NRRL 1555(-)]|eukprot:XP_018295807.1 hypothetical protein PHYBLDRAFT_141629 [Phycomyces blakesleeanus NRRL 1555(-)]
MDSKLTSRLDLLADNTLSIIFERNKLKDLKLNYEKYEATINKNLAKLKEGIKTLEQQLSAEEETGATNTNDDEDKLVQIQVKLNKLEVLLGGDEASARDILLGNKRGKTVRFSSPHMEVDPSDLENGQILQLQQRVIQDQDDDLDQLSLVIGRHRELGLLIGDELESHAQLIDETEIMVDRTDARLRKAKKKLDYVGRKVKDNSK